MQNAQKNACNLKKFQYNKGEKPNRTSADIFWKEGELMYKKRFLRLVSAVLALCMMAALLPTAAFAADPLSPGTTFSYPHKGKTLKYTVNADGNGTTVSVAAQGKDAVSGDVVIPATVKDGENTYNVTSIGDHAFSSCERLTDVTFEANSQLASIGAYAFSWCISLTSVTIPSSVTSIGDRAFYDCYQLTSVTIPSGVTGIGAYAFSSCGRLTDVTFEANSQLASIGAYAFSWCKLLKNVTFADNSQLASIGDSAFNECSALESVTIPSSVTSIGNSAFNECSALESIVIPEGVETIGNYVFQGCSDLQTVTIPASVKSVGSDIFESANQALKITYDGTKKQWGELGVVWPDSSSVTYGKVSVTFDANGHGTAPENVCVKTGETIQKPVDPTETGYIFKGWYYTENETEKEFVFGETKVTSDLTLTAKWTKGSYTLTVDGNAESHVYDEEVTVDEPTKEGYTFAGWTVETKNVTPQKGDDGKWSFQMPAGKVTLTAKWEINRYTVKFMNGEDEVKSITADYNSTIAVNDAPVAPVKDGYAFGGWYNGTEKFVFGETKVTSDLTLTAKWTKGSYTLTVDGSAEGHDYDEEVTVDEPTKEGYTFAGWTVETKNVTPKKGNDGKWRFKMPAGNVTLTAEWKINEYTVVFVTAYDNTPNALTVKHGETISGDRILKADGYEFGGWYNGTEKFVFGENGTKVTGNLTLTARWTEAKKPDPTPEPDPEPVVYEIVVDNGTAYLDDGATAIHTAEEGQTVILKVNPEALTEGVAFDKWEIVSGDVKLADETASETRFEMPASAVELKATVKAVEIPAAPAAINPASVMAGTVVLGAGAVSVGWSAYHIATELYLKWVLPQGIIPTTRGQLALLLWNQADQPAAESTALYTDIDASDEQTAARWVIENKKMELVNSDEADVFEPDLPVDIFAVAKAWRKK